MGGCDWSEIPEDILVTIAKRLSLTDYFFVTQACKTWRSVTLSPCNHIPIPQPPFLFLAEPNPKKKKNMEAEADTEQVDEDTDESEWGSEKEEEEEEEKAEEEEEDDDSEEITGREIVGLNCRSGDKIRELHLPELHGNRCVGSTGNWLVIVNKEEEISILNPFTRLQFQLPSQSTLPQYIPNEECFGNSIIKVRDRFLSKIVLSSTPKFNNPDSQAAIAAAIYGCLSQLAIARPGDQSWMPLNSGIPDGIAVNDVIFFRNRLYYVNGFGVLAFYDDFNTLRDPILTTRVSKFRIQADKYYLVEWLGELLLVLRFYSFRRRYPSYKTKEFRVFRFNFHQQEWDEVNCLGQHSLFLGFSTSVCLLALPDSTFRKNCIYFTDDYRVRYHGSGIRCGHDMGVFDFEDGTIKPHYDGISISWYSPPLWVIPTSLSEV